MKQNKDWTDVMRSALRDTKVTPPADGWARLERELGPHPRISVLRSHWPRIAAAAAAVLIFLGGGGYLLHENRDLGDKGFVIATATDSGSSAADMAQVDGTPAGDGEGTLAGALRAAVPTEEAVRAAALPGEEPGAGTAPGIAPGRDALAAADMRGFEDGRAAALTSGAVPAGEAVAANAVTGNSVAENAVAGSEASGKASAAAAATGDAAADGTRPAVRAAVAGQASATDGNPGEEAAGQAVQPRKYPGTYDYLADGVQEYRRPRRKTSVSLFAAGGVTGSSGVSGGGRPQPGDVRHICRRYQRHDGAIEIQLQGLFVPPPPAAQLRPYGAQGIRARVVARKRCELYVVMVGRTYAVRPRGYQPEAPLHRGSPAP